MATTWLVMTMKIRGALIPDEWQAAHEAGVDLRGVVSKTVYGWFKVASSLLIPVLTGGIVFLVLAKFFPGIGRVINADVLRSILTLLAVLSGFMITTILFTGRPNGLASLSSSELQDVRDKISYLVLSQCITLISHLFSILVCLGILALISLQESIPRILIALFSGVVLNSLVRATLLPLQIWEVHAFAIDVEISERMRVEREKIFGSDG